MCFAGTLKSLIRCVGVFQRFTYETVSQFEHFYQIVFSLNARLYLVLCFKKTLHKSLSEHSR